MSRPATLLATIALLLLAGLKTPLPAQTPSTAVAIVVHPSLDIDNLTFDELRRIFRGERQLWPGGSRITLLVRAPVAQERRIVLEKIYRMSEAEYRQHWIAKMFRAEVAAGPKLVYSSEMARELVTAIPGAIGFMPANSVGGGVKVIKIDNRLPSDPGYILR
jgi:ABC-type phosphate transport system substrate-binding protein